MMALRPPPATAGALLVPTPWRQPPVPGPPAGRCTTFLITFPWIKNNQKPLPVLIVSFWLFNQLLMFIFNPFFPEQSWKSGWATSRSDRTLPLCLPAKVSFVSRSYVPYSHLLRWVLSQEAVGFLRKTGSHAHLGSGQLGAASSLYLLLQIPVSPFQKSISTSSLQRPDLQRFLKTLTFPSCTYFSMPWGRTNPLAPLRGHS